MLQDFDFELPQELIAAHPLERGKSRLIFVDEDKHFKEMLFEDIHCLLEPGDVLVLNNTKVIPSCLQGTVDKKQIKINLANRQDNNQRETWEVLSKPRKKLKLDSTVTFSGKLRGKVIEKYNENGMDVIEFNLNSEQFHEELNEIGTIPLPPYMRRQAEEQDKMDYQTVFSKVKGSVAAPTAGLHFTEELMRILEKKGVNLVYITLHVGSGTFLPVRVERISDHEMHREFYSIDQKACDMINDAKAKGNRVIGVGTTSARTLESAAKFCEGQTLSPHSNHTKLFITEGYKFKIIDGLVTNFHLPKSTLFILVCALLGGSVHGKELYNYAIEKKYRFFSYGDACFLNRFL